MPCAKQMTDMNTSTFYGGIASMGIIAIHSAWGEGKDTLQNGSGISCSF